MRKVSLVVIALFVCTFMFSARSFALPLSFDGKIKGQIVLCNSSIQGVAGTLVYIAGKSFMAKLAEDGQFVLYNVPLGKHTLTVEIPGQNPFTIADVVVRPHRIANVGVQNICPDNDNDGFNLAEDCNDNDPYTYPGSEVTDYNDGVDNDCDGQDGEDDLDGDWYSVADGDCDDYDPSINPDAADDTCDQIDNDCDGSIDEDASGCSPS